MSKESDLLLRLSLGGKIANQAEADFLDRVANRLNVAMIACDCPDCSFHRLLVEAIKERIEESRSPS